MSGFGGNPNQRDGTQGTASVKLTRQTGTNEENITTWKGCIVDKASLETLEKIICPKGSWTSLPNYFVYLSNIELEKDVRQAEIKCYRYTKETEKECDPLSLPFDEKVLINFNHVFLPCKSKTFDSSTFLEKHSKNVTGRIVRPVNLHGKRCFGLQPYEKDGKSLNTFVSFEIKKSNTYYVEPGSVFECLEDTGPLLLDDYKRVVGCYEKIENTIIICTFGYEEKLTVFCKALAFHTENSDAQDPPHATSTSNQHSQTQKVTDSSQSVPDNESHKVLLGHMIQKLVVSIASKKQIENLAESDFVAHIESLCKDFHPKTRQWVFNQVHSHIAKDSRVLLITSGTGMGKSTIAAKLCDMYERNECLGACHFFQHGDSRRDNPRLMLQSIARQLCDSVPGFKDALAKKFKTDLGKKISEMKCQELFTVLLEEPLRRLQVDKPYAVVIDALDECCGNFKNEFVQAVSLKLKVLPSWLKFVITTRTTTSSIFANEYRIDIQPGDPENVQDLTNYFSNELKALQHQDQDYQSVIHKLVQSSQGIFLVASFVIQDIRNSKVLPSLLDVSEIFPNNISFVYERYFSRLKDVLLPDITREKQFFDMLKKMASTSNSAPISKEHFYSILGLESERKVHHVKEAVELLHSIFPIEETDHVTAFHKTVIYWLTKEGHEFSVPG